MPLKNEEVYVWSLVVSNQARTFVSSMFPQIFLIGLSSEEPKPDALCDVTEGSLSNYDDDHSDDFKKQSV